MQILSKVFDWRLNCWNIVLESTFGEYLSFADKVLNNNDFQRQRVRTSRTVYSLLKNDLLQGCVIPPLVLATKDMDFTDPESLSGSSLLEFINNHTEKVIILDGLQRTYTLKEARNDASLIGDDERLNRFLKNQLRLEFYININRFGILYRMLTLNTGQTPMTSRHQIEILYSDLLSKKVNGIELVTDMEGKANPNDNQFVFKSVIDGFHSYLNRSELPIDRQDILDNISMLERMTDEDLKKDLFPEFISNYFHVYDSLRMITNNHVLSDDELIEYSIESPFGKSVAKIFSSSQALTGYGAAMGKLKDNGIIQSFNTVDCYLNELRCRNSDDCSWMIEMIKRLEIIKNTSKKIGNAQRMLFLYFFRELFNKETDSFLDLKKSVINGYQKYNSQVN